MILRHKMSRERSISICAPRGSCRALAAIMWTTRPQGLAPPSSHIDACGGTTRGLPKKSSSSGPASRIAPGRTAKQAPVTASTSTSDPKR
jgi:hypothetical protein